MTPAPLLRTRLAPPRLPRDCLARRALAKRVAEGLEGPLVAVVAGPGYGKTTLLVQALAELDSPWIWCSCDEGLASAAAVVTHLAAGLAEHFPGFGAALNLEGSLEEIVAVFINEFDAILVEDVVLALDDIHLLPAEGAAALRLVVGALPTRAHVLLASRSAAAVPQPRSGPRGALELGEPDLALSETEAADLLGAMGTELSPAEITRAHRLTEGWLAGLLAASHTGGQVHIGEGRGGFDDMARELLAAQPEKVRRFVLDMAPLERFTPAIAAAVSGQAEAGDLCRRLVAERLFTVRLTGPGDWYRFHHLFARYLRAEIAVQDPVRLEALHRRAAAAWETAGQPLEAARHYIEAGDWGGAAEALEPVAEAMAASPGAEQLDVWLRAMPSRQVNDRPSLVLARATLLLGRAEHEASFAAFEQAVEALLAGGDHDRAAVALFRLLQAMLAAGTRPDRRVEIGARWLERLEPSAPMVPAARVLHAVGCAYACRFAEAEAELECARAAADDDAVPLYASGIRAHFITWARDGRPEALEELDGSIAPLAQNPGRDRLALLPGLRLLRGYLLNDLGRHQDALDEVERARSAASERGLSRTPGRMVAWLRSVALARLGRLEDLERELAPPDRIPALYEASSYAYRYHAVGAQLAAARGDRAAATSHARLAEGGLRAFGGVSDDPAFLCDLALAVGDVGEHEWARRLAGEARARAQAIGATWQRARAALVGAAVEEDAARDRLTSEALDASVDPVFETLWTHRERARAGPLLARALRQHLGPPQLAARLVARCGGEVLARCAEELDDAPPAARVLLAESAAEAVAADSAVLDKLLRDRDAAVRASARGSWARLRERPRAALRIETMGELQVWRDGVRVPDAAFGRQKARALFGLLLAEGRAVHREELCEALWPDLGPERAAGALRTTLHDLRRALHPEVEASSPVAVVVADGEAVRIQLDARDFLDLRELEAVAAAVRARAPRLDLPRLEAAADLRRGPFLAEWPYADWATERRELVQDAYGWVLEGLARELGQLGRHDAACESWQRLVALDPQREGWHRALMRSYVAAGERALALRQFHACRAVLRREQGIEPGRETRELYSTILRDDDPGLATPDRDTSVTTVA